MKQRVTIALLTIVLLGVGFGAGWWVAHSRCTVPVPPPTLLGELTPKRPPEEAPATSQPKKSAPRAPDPAKLAKQIGELQPQIEEFRAKLEAIDRELDRRIEAILRPEQQKAWQKLVRRGEESRERERAEIALETKLSSDEIRELQLQPLHRLLGIIVVPIRVYWNTKQLKLDDAQKAQLTEHLKWRREQFIQLIDESPPPSLELSTLAPMVQRLGEAPKP